MAIFRRNKTYWTDFSVNGARHRQSLSTTDWREAQTHEKELITQASTGKLTRSGQQFARLAFTEAADRYVADRLAHLAPHSIVTERERLKSLRVFFWYNIANSHFRRIHPSVHSATQGSRPEQSHREYGDRLPGSHPAARELACGR